MWVKAAYNSLKVQFSWKEDYYVLPKIHLGTSGNNPAREAKKEKEWEFGPYESKSLPFSSRNCQMWELSEVKLGQRAWEASRPLISMKLQESRSKSRPCCKRIGYGIFRYLYCFVNSSWLTRQNAPPPLQRKVSRHISELGYIILQARNILKRFDEVF